MKQRVIYGTLCALITLGMIAFSVYTRVTFFILCGLGACYEMRKALNTIGYRIPAWFGYSVCAVCSALIAVGKAGYSFPAFMVLMVALFTQLILLGNIDVKDVYAALGMCAYPVCNVLLLVYIAMRNEPEGAWAAILLNSIVPAIVCDTFALFGGKFFGKHKLSPHISPKKTVEGLICGVVFGTLSGFGVYAIVNALGYTVVKLWVMLLSALLASLFGALGDLAASAVKRTAGIKDYSKLIPGHGGIMDRVDSAIFAAPVVYWLYAMFI